MPSRRVIHTDRWLYRRVAVLFRRARIRWQLLPPIRSRLRPSGSSSNPGCRHLLDEEEAVAAIGGMPKVTVKAVGAGGSDSAARQLRPRVAGQRPPVEIERSLIAKCRRSGRTMVQRCDLAKRGVSLTEDRRIEEHERSVEVAD
eukprot:4722349-Prymnesium_polylepis.1